MITDLTPEQSAALAAAEIQISKSSPPTIQDDIRVAVHAEMSKLVEELRATMHPGLSLDEWFRAALDAYLRDDQ
jgi:hypothetical protein